MQTFKTFLTAALIAAMVATLLAAVPLLFDSVFILWIVSMIVLLAVTEYVRNRHHLPPY